MWPFTKKDSDLHHYLKNSFSRVKEDNQHLSQWIRYLHQANQEQQNQLHQLHQKIQQQHLNASHQASASPSFLPYYHHLHQRLEQLSQKVDSLLENHKTHSEKLDYHAQKLDHFHQKITALENPRPKQSFKEKIVQTFSRHSKNYLKNLIFNYLEQHQKISALQLKDIIVDQQGLASKSSFYRILAEIEQSDQLTVIKEGKQKIFLFKAALNR